VNRLIRTSHILVRTPKTSVLTVVRVLFAVVTVGLRDWVIGNRAKPPAPSPQSPVPKSSGTTRHSISRFALFAVTATALATVAIYPYTRSAHVQATTNNTINFQARVLTNTGAVVPDGTYNVQFNLYNVATAGTALWTESYLNNASQGITTKNGYITASLGSLTSFPSTIQWDQNLYLGMTIRGTGSCAFGSCTPTDAEMSPRMKVTAVPFATAAAQLQTSSGSFTSTLALNTPTVGNQVFQLQDQAAAGTYYICVQNSSSCGYVRLGQATAQTDTTTNSSIFINKTGASGNLILAQHSSKIPLTLRPLSKSKTLLAHLFSPQTQPTAISRWAVVPPTLMQNSLFSIATIAAPTQQV